MRRFVRVFAGALAGAVFAMGAELPKPSSPELPKPLSLDLPKPKTVEAPKVQTLPPNSLPVILSTDPEQGALDVDPELKEITVRFDRDMEEGFSWTGGGPEFPGKRGEKPVWKDKRTCAMPAALEPGKFYRFGINSQSFQNFRSSDGLPVRPRTFYFVTRGASEEVKALARKPKVVEMIPPNGATDVDPATKELRVTFDIPMAGTFSWTGSGPMFPPAPSDPEKRRPVWSEDGKTAILPVELKPGSEYRLGLNSTNRFNFQSTNGVPIDAVVYTFKTKGAAAGQN